MTVNGMNGGLKIYTSKAPTVPPIPYIRGIVFGDIFLFIIDNNGKDTNRWQL